MEDINKVIDNFDVSLVLLKNGLNKVEEELYLFSNSLDIPNVKKTSIDDLDQQSDAFKAYLNMTNYLQSQYVYWYNGVKTLASTDNSSNIFLGSYDSLQDAINKFCKKSFKRIKAEVQSKCKDQKNELFRKSASKLKEKLQGLETRMNCNSYMSKINETGKAINALVKNCESTILLFSHLRIITEMTRNSTWFKSISNRSPPENIPIILNGDFEKFQNFNLEKAIESHSWLDLKFFKECQKKTQQQTIVTRKRNIKAAEDEVDDSNKENNTIKKSKKTSTTSAAINIKTSSSSISSSSCTPAAINIKTSCSNVAATANIPSTTSSSSSTANSSSALSSSSTTPAAINIKTSCSSVAATANISSNTSSSSTSSSSSSAYCSSALSSSSTTPAAVINIEAFSSNAAATASISSSTTSSSLSTANSSFAQTFLSPSEMITLMWEKYKKRQIDKSQFFMKLILYINLFEDLRYFIDYFIILEELAMKIGNTYSSSREVRKFVEEFGEQIVNLVVLFHSWEEIKKPSTDFVVEIANLYPISYSSLESFNELKEICNILAKLSCSITKEDVLIAKLSGAGFHSIRNALYHIIINEDLEALVVEEKKEECISLIESLVVRKHVDSPFKFQSEVTKDRLWMVIQTYHSSGNQLPNADEEQATKYKKEFPVPVRIPPPRKAKESGVAGGQKRYNSGGDSVKDNNARRKRTKKKELDEESAKDNDEGKCDEDEETGNNERVIEESVIQEVVHHSHNTRKKSAQDNNEFLSKVCEGDDKQASCSNTVLENSMPSSTFLDREEIDEDIEFSNPEDALAWLVEQMSIHKDISIEEILEGIQELLLGVE